MSPSVRAPELQTSLGWLNTDRPLRFSDELKGQVVVLDFWTYCCINCIHILPDLKFLEHKYADEPVCFIGVHSAKFSNESSRETIRAAVLRYEIEHPVVIDENMAIWRQFAARSWPTIVVVDAKGYVVGTTSGEGQRAWLDDAIGQALSQGKSAGALADAPLALSKEGSVRAASGLHFPGKILADNATKRIYIADSNHNRIVIADWPDERGHARLVRIVGSGEIGRDDGPAASATFDHPQGLAVGQGQLYVADTENHLVRAVDLKSFEVRTAVGTGEMCNDRAGGLMGTAQGLNSPWDLAIEGSTLYVAMAGVHQVWRIDMPVGFARAFAGSGRENLVDGPTETAALAQPSGICASRGHLYFADSEVSAIRGIDMNLEQVFTVIGEGLFTFGDVDGPHNEARLQHPLGIDGWGNLLVVADTYNHKIKLVDPGARSVRTILGSGQPGTVTQGGGPAFFEPGGISVAGDELFVADTNNHRIVRVNLKTQEWREVVVEGLAAPTGRSDDGGDAAIGMSPQEIDTGSEVEVRVSLQLPEGAHLNEAAPCSVRVAHGDTILAQSTCSAQAGGISVTVPAGSVSAPGEWLVTASAAFCMGEGQGVCVPANVSWRVPVQSGGSGRTIDLSAKVADPTVDR